MKIVLEPPPFGKRLILNETHKRAVGINKGTNAAASFLGFGRMKTRLPLATVDPRSSFSIALEQILRKCLKMLFPMQPLCGRYTLTRIRQSDTQHNIDPTIK
jgi:hypothetical protein